MFGEPHSPSWVQILGRVAVHSDGEARRLTGSGQRLLAVLVAAGVGGATAERIAEEIWGENQPDPWRPALRMAVTRLRKRLPAGWDVVADGGSYRIVCGAGWIDAWRLEDVAASGEPVKEKDLEWILAGAPFGDLDLLEMVAASTERLKLLQAEVVARFCGQAPASLSSTTCSLLSGLLRDHPYDERLATTTAATLRAAGRRHEALAALSAFAKSFSAEFDYVPEEVSDFLQQGRDATVRTEPPGVVVPTSSVRQEVPKELAHLTDTPLLGRSEELARMLASKGAVLSGPSGSGKSRLLAELIAVDTSRQTTYVVGDDRLGIRLAPFALAMPDLRDELGAVAEMASEAHLDDRHTLDQTAIARAWRVVLTYLERRASVEPQRLVVDDAHRLDRVSLGVLKLLIRSNTTADIVVVVAGQGVSEDVRWTELLLDSERAGSEFVELGGLDLSEISEMVYTRYPHAILLLREALAREVFEASGGLPAVAAPLIDSADPATLTLPDQLVGLPALARLTGTFSDGGAKVLAAAATLGQQFSIGALIALTELDEPAVFLVLDELWSANLIVETNDPDQLRFRHLLIQRSLLEGVPLFRRGQLHRRAAALTQDPHERADHLVSASSLISEDVKAAALLESARVYAGRQLWRLVTRELRRIECLQGDYLDVAGYTLWAMALDRSGSDGTPYRKRAFEIAIAADDATGALDAALSGLPEAERPDGDDDRIAMLEAISADALTQRQRFTRASTLCRQYSLKGDEVDKVLFYANRSIDAAGSPDERGIAYVLRWSATRHHPFELSELPPGLAVGVGLSVRVRIAQVTAISLAEEGNFDDARSAVDEFSRLANELGDPFRLWHAMGFEGLFLMNDGKFAQAHELAQETMKFAGMHDIHQGVAAYVGNTVFASECQGLLSELQPELEPFRADLGRMLVGRAGLAICDQAVGSRVAAQDMHSAMSDAFERDGGTMSVLSALFLAPYIAECAPELVPRARALLERFGDRPVLASFGGANFGPTVRYLAHLSADPEEKEQLISQAIAAADRQGPLLWRVRTRLDRAALGSAAALEDAVALAEGTELAEVVQRFADGLR